MARRRQKYSIQTCEKWLSEGFGVGEAESYKPWIRIGDFSSRGVSTAMPGIKVKRIHELLSGPETRAFLRSEFCSEVVDIREQFPLLPLDHVVAVAEQAGIKYPVLNGALYILTTDLLLTLNISNKVSYLAIAVKPTSELRKTSVLEKLEIERLWWTSLGVEWRLCTEEDISEAFGDNLTWISQDFREELFDYESVDVAALAAIHAMFPPRFYLIGDLIAEIAEQLKIEPAIAKTMLCKAIWEKHVRVDLEVSIQKDGLLSILEWRFDKISEGTNDIQYIA